MKDSLILKCIALILQNKAKERWHCIITETYQRERQEEFLLMFKNFTPYNDNLFIRPELNTNRSDME